MQRITIQLLLGAALCVSACDASGGLEAAPQPALVAILSDSLTRGESRCLFTLRLTSTDTLIDVTYRWDIDRTRSQLATVAVIPDGESGSFRRDWVRRWEWRRPDDGSALILNLSYRLDAPGVGSGGRLITFCP